MNFDLVQIEIILWILVMILIFISCIIMYKRYKKDKTKYLLGITLFFILFFLCRICTFTNYYIFGFKGDIYLLDDLTTHPEWFWLQFGYNEFSYGGAFILYFVLERYIIKTKYIFSISTLIEAVLSTINYLIVPDLTLIQVPFYLIVLLGFPSIYLYLAIKSAGQVRINSLLISIGVLIFEVGMALAIPEAQLLLWSQFMEPIVYKILGPTLQFVGNIIMLSGFVRVK
ncbi:MAG: hypothetical protein ACTSRP_08255 [Candidatus Helarchaeota archaeon]